MSDQDAAHDDDEEAEQTLQRDVVEPGASEADVIEQSRVVESQQVVAPRDRPDDVPEADWLEQSIEESADDER